jgi:hypothetical protein
VKLLPTPMAGDSKGTRNATAGRKRDNPNVNAGWTLSDVIHDGQLSNPPAPPVDAASGCTTPEGSAPDPVAAPAPTLNSDGPMKLMPTPRATDGTKGGPHQRGSKGDLMLPSLAAQLLPTPTASDSERTSSAYGRGNPTLTGAITNPPSDGGKPSSDAPPPGQPTFWDD